MSDSPKPESAPAAASKSKLPLIIGGAVVLLAAAGGGAYYFLKVKPAAAEKAAKAGHGDEEGHDAEAEEAAADEKEPMGVIPLDPFVVNLADQEATRFLRLTLKLVVPEEKAKEAEKDEVGKARIRSSVLELLAQQTADSLVTPDGKAGLKKEIAQLARKSQKGLKVNDVLFSEFVVQF